MKRFVLFFLKKKNEISYEEILFYIFLYVEFFFRIYSEEGRTRRFNNLEICCQGRHFEQLYPIHMLPSLGFNFRDI